MNGAAPRLTHSIDSILEDKELMMTHLCHKCLAALLCGAAIQKNGLAFHQELDEVGMTLVDW